MRKNTIVFAVILSLGLFTFSQKETFAATPEHKHNLVVCQTEIISETPGQSCSYDENCVVSSIIYRCTYICTVHGCGFKENRYKVETHHSIEH